MARYDVRLWPVYSHKECVLGEETNLFFKWILDNILRPLFPLLVFIYFNLWNLHSRMICCEFLCYSWTVRCLMNSCWKHMQILWLNVILYFVCTAVVSSSLCAITFKIYQNVFSIKADSFVFTCDHFFIYVCVTWLRNELEQLPYE